ncbi:MAG TPA: hypothetical protein VN935_10635 [Rhizomicrobium sp.]|jgi:hypothetical protein|nr:hypothetical protein [Rhizomicrobium sp.]
MNRTVIALGMMGALVALGGTAHADTRGDVLSGIARCGAIADDHTWLNCIYGAAQPMRGQLGLPPAPASQTALVPAASPASPRFSSPAPAAAAPKESGGFFSRILGGEAVITAMPLSSYRFDSQGFFTITLANGQVWEERDGPVAHWQGPASQYLVTISKGAMGSFNLTVARESEQYKVRRVPANARRG